MVITDRELQDSIKPRGATVLMVGADELKQLALEVIAARRLRDSMQESVDGFDVNALAVYAYDQVRKGEAGEASVEGRTPRL